MSTLRFRQTEIPEGVIDLGLGQPDDTVFPRAIFQRAAARVLTDGSSVDQFQYGAEWGDGHHRVALAEFLTAAYGVAVDPEMLLSSNGNSQALDLVCTTFTRHGDAVIVEEPSYHLIRGAFTDHGLQVTGVPVDDDGLDPAAVDEVLTRLAENGTPARFVYTIPTHHNPTAVTMPAERRAALVEVTARHGCLLVADEVYHLLTYAGDPPPPFSQWVARGHDHVLSLGTFSKILAPGLRLGWVHAALPLLERLANTGVVASGGGLNPFTSALVTDVIRSGDLAGNVAALCDDYRERLAAMNDALVEHMPAGVQWQRPTGGYFFWLTLPDGADGADVRRRCQAHGVDIRHGALFSTTDGQRRAIRLCFAYYHPAEITEGVRRLARALAE